MRKVEEIYRASYNQYYKPYQSNPIKCRKRPEKSFAEILEEMKNKNRS